VPGNFDEPSHTIRRDLAATPPYDAQTAGVATPDAHDAATYLRALQPLVASVDAWETTYLHVLHGEDPVFTWVSGTGARPTLQALDETLRPRTTRTSRFSNPPRRGNSWAPHPMRIFHDAVADIRPPDARSYFTLERTPAI